MEAYAYTITNGVSDDRRNTSRNFVIFAKTKEISYKFCEDYVSEEIENDKYENDDGDIVNHWWKSYSIDEVNIKDITVASIRVID